MNKLIIIRGPSGAGKSTVAKALMESVTRPTALIERDHYMFMFKAADEDKVPDKELIEHNVLFCLERGFDVIFEGNFKATTHHPLLQRLFRTHPDENYIFYIDASLEETLRRHDTRKEKTLSRERMKELYSHATPLGHPTEVKISEHLSLEETIELIKHTTAL